MNANSQHNRRFLISICIWTLFPFSFVLAQQKIDQKGAGILTDSTPSIPVKTVILPVETENLLSPEMVTVIGGTYLMGCTTDQDQAIKQFYSGGCQTTTPFNFTDASPVREVTLQNFMIGKYEVSQSEWSALMGNNPSFFKNCVDSCPVENVSWFGAAVYCNRLSVLEGYTPCYYSDANFTQTLGLNGANWSIPNSGSVFWKTDASGYRLPTEAEWEYAARGGGLQTGKWYAGSNVINDVSWYFDNSFVTYSPNVGGRGTHLHGQKSSNELGLFDMSGNAFEWCYDWYNNNYNGLAGCSPTGVSNGTDRVMRGGAWGATAILSLVSVRSYFAPANVGNNVGFRLARTP